MELAGPRALDRPRESARNHLSGIVTKVLRDRVAAQVEVQAGPHRIVSLLTREAADELRLEPGVLCVAVVKATNVVIELPAPEARSRSTRRTKAAVSTSPRRSRR